MIVVDILGLYKDLYIGQKMVPGLSIKPMLNPKQQPMKCASTTIGVIIPPRIMKTKIRFIEVGRFFICLGISWIAWMCMWSTGSIFLGMTHLENKNIVSSFLMETAFF